MSEAEVQLTSEMERVRDLFEAHPKVPEDVAIVIPVRPADGLAVELAEVVAKWVLLGFSVSFMKDAMGGFIEIARQKMAHDFLRYSPKTFVMMIDNDIAPPVELPFLLARHDKPVVAGPTPILMGKHGVCMNYTVRDENGVPRFPSLERHTSLPSRGLLEVPHVGTGAMLIRRDVLEAFEWSGEDVPFYIPQHYRQEGAKTGSLRRGEDIEFCAQVRRKGFSVYVDLEATCGHRKSFVVTWPPHQLDPDFPLDKLKTVAGEYAISE